MARYVRRHFHDVGPPQFPDHPILTWEEFCADYSNRFFCPEGDGFGRLFIIGAKQREVGCIGYDGPEPGAEAAWDAEIANRITRFDPERFNLYRLPRSSTACVRLPRPELVSR